MEKKTGQNIILIGFMGTGKSTVGRRLAKRLEWDFLDTDAEIEELTGLSIPEVFKKHGEKRFRSEELLLVQHLPEKKHVVIATGGGMIVNPENRAVLEKSGCIISLYAPVDVILERVGSRSDRPLLKRSLDEIEELWQKRQPVYEDADYIVDTTNKTVEEVEEEILRWLKGESYIELA